MVIARRPSLEQFAQVFREPVKTFIENMDAKPGDGGAPGERRAILPGSATDDGVRASTPQPATCSHAARA
jgi:hypothetical protein